ncbi:MAG TPA: Lrp/AsnC ligand binding domain-containing protein [Gemmatimonadaceae bacterium]|jgi:DNA-binding Lrp family transcriptional regulator
MITTIVLVKAEPRLIPQCAKQLAAIEGVTDVYSVSGEWDLVVIVKVPQYDDIARIVTEQFPVVPGLVRTTTLTAFKAYSKADLEGGWDVGSG